MVLAVGFAVRQAPAAEPAPGYSAPQFDVPKPGDYELPELGAAADAVVLDSSGAEIRLHEAFGPGIAVLAFVYTSCAEAGGCPLANYVMRETATRVVARDPLRGRVRFVSLSFDPARDTPARMAEQSRLAPDGADWRFVTTASEAAVAPILDAYGQSVVRLKGKGEEATTEIAHVLRVFLIDGKKRIRNIYSSSFLHAATLLADIETLALEHRAETEALERTDAAHPRGYDAIAVARAARVGLPPVPEPDDDPLTAAKVALGRKLFFDRRLSRNGTVSCAMCHVPAQGFTQQELATPVGIEGRSVRRNAPTLYDVAYKRRLFHDGREDRLEQQIWGPLLAENEMGNPSVGFVLEGIRARRDYDGLFEAAFDGAGVGMETLGRALAAYQRTLVSGESAFDRWRFGGDDAAMSDDAKRGFALFAGEAGCASCHRIEKEEASFTDHSAHDTGIGYRSPRLATTSLRRMQVAPGEYVDLHADAGPTPPPPADLGRYEITGDPADRWKFQTPGLRNVALTAPYMHDGSLATLEDVVEFYDGGGVPHDELDPALRPLALSAEQKRDLVAFLRALTGANTAALVADALAAPVGDPAD